MKADILPDDATIFRCKPRPSIGAILVGIVRFIVLALILAWFLLANFARHNPAIARVIRSSFGLLITSSAITCVNVMRRTRNMIAVNSDGIWQVPPKGHSTFIAWTDIASFEPKNAQQCLILTHKDNTTRIEADYQLDGFEQLRNLIVDHISHNERGPSETIFRRSHLEKRIFIICGVGALLVALFSLRSGQYPPSFVFLVFAGLSIFAILQDPSSLEITTDAFILRYPGRQQVIPFSTVDDIEMTQVGHHGKVATIVLLKIRRGKPIRLARFGENALVFYQALKMAWQVRSGAEHAGPAIDTNSYRARYAR